MDSRTIAAVEAQARAFVDSFSDATLAAIVRGEYPARFAAFSAQRVGVYTRAALIVLDARANEYPASVEQLVEAGVGGADRGREEPREADTNLNAGRRRDAAARDCQWRETRPVLAGDTDALAGRASSRVIVAAHHDSARGW